MANLYEPDVVDLQKELRKQVTLIFSGFSIDRISAILKERKKIEEIQISLMSAVEGTREGAFFRNEKLLLDTVFMLCEWCQKILSGSTDADVKLNAAIANVNLIDTNIFSYLEIFDNIILEIKHLVNDISAAHLNNVNLIVNHFLKLQHPTIAYLNSENNFRLNYGNQEDTTNVPEEMIIVSLEFYIHGTPWANPQILKAKEVYTITGSLKFNKSPKDYKLLKLLSATTNNEIFELKLEDIALTEMLEFQVEGTLVFKYPQSNFEDNLSIKLIPYLLGDDKKELQPLIIGYDELNAKVLDQRNILFQTGFESIDKKVFEIFTNPLLAEVEIEDRQNFIRLLNGITNFQGYCLQSGMYKNIASLKEDHFRDNLIQHLMANPQLGGNIVKESHVSGGRVEIAYKGHIAELKVETSNSNRSKLMEKYSSQAVAYASGNAKSLSIVCILDLTKKLLPPSPAANNVILKSPTFHGFEDSNLNQHVQVFVFIDGNTKNPSDYSR